MGWRSRSITIKINDSRRTRRYGIPGDEAVSPSDIERIDAACDRDLSAALREFYLNYPAELRATNSGDPDDERNSSTECPADNELCDHADGLIALNDRRPGGNAAFME